MPTVTYDWNGNPIYKYSDQELAQAQAAKYKQDVESEIGRVQQGGGMAEQEFRKNLLEANRQMASAATGRGANPLAERAAMYAGERNIAQGEQGAMAARESEMARLAALKSGAVGQQLGVGQWAADFAEQQRQAKEKEKLAREQFEYQKGQAGVNAFMGVLGAAGGAASMMSDENNKTQITPAGMAYSDKDFRDILGSYQFGKQNPQTQAPIERGLADIDRQMALENKLGEIDARSALFERSKTWQAPDEDLRSEYGLEPEMAYLENTPARAINTPFEGAGYTPADFTDAEALQAPSMPQSYSLPRYTSAKPPTRMGGGPSTPFFGKGGMLATLGGTAEGTSKSMLSGLNTKTDVQPAGVMLSDEMGKMGKTPAGAGNVQDQLIDNLTLYSYKYKPEFEGVAGVPPEDAGRRRVGIMAQDLASSPVGRPAVKATPVGMGIDRDQAIGLALGLTGRLGERIDELEKKVK